MQTDNIIRLQHTDIHIFIGLNTKVSHKSNRAGLKNESQPCSSQFAKMMDRLIYSAPEQTQTSDCPSLPVETRGEAE